MSRPLIATIDLSALRANYLLAKRLHGARVLAVVKANAYGHGAVQCAHALADLADGFAVASIEEAIALRDAGITLPILLLEGWFHPDELPLIQHHDLWTTVHRLDQIDAVLNCQLYDPLTIWLKIDVGMHRLGIAPSEAPAAISRLRHSRNVAKLVAMSHFSRSDLLDDATTATQIDRLRQAIGDFQLETSLSNSGGIIAWPNAKSDWGRAGIMLYGGAAVDRPISDAPMPVMQLDSRIIATRQLAAGEAVGYGERYVTTKPTRIGVVACGYADGYPRAATNGTPVLINGQASQLIGRVSMDMLTVDLTHLPAADIDTPVRLWGVGLAADRVASHANTVAYELFCNVKRARFVYRQD